MLEHEKGFVETCILLCIYVSISQLALVVSQITLGTKLSVDGNNPWTSSNGDFSVGFFNCSDQLPNLFSVGIQFKSNLIPASKHMVVWVAGADVCVGNKSYFELTEDGEMVLFDSLKGIAVWTSETRALAVVKAIIRNDGNLVLLNMNDTVVWQSFDTPSDTLLPGQMLSSSQMLRASSKNSVSSYYGLYMNGLGQLQLRWETSVVYWTSASHAHSNLTAMLTTDGVLQLLDRSSKPVWSVFGDDHNDSVRFRFLRLDVDGNLRLYSWVESLRSWRSVWQAVENQCNVFATCGLHGVCVFDGSGVPVCKCPFRSTSTDSGLQCLIPYRRNCDSGSTVVTYEHTRLYGLYPANDTISQTSLRQCKKSCLDEPLCTAVTYTNDGTAQCRMKMTKYISGYSDPSLSSVSFVKMCLDPVAALPKIPISSPPHSVYQHSYGLSVPCLIGATSGVFIAFVMIQVGIGFYVYKRRRFVQKRAILAYNNHHSKGLIVFSYAEIKDVSENFKHQISPRMFKGVLADGGLVTIKEMQSTIEERKFRCAAIRIGNIHHKNLVKLEGYCCESTHRYLVYEFGNNGSVDKFIEVLKLSRRLTWKRRIDMCLSVARAVSYLHSGCREFLNHGNLRWENVVLDENFEAKVTKFGLSRLVCDNINDSNNSASIDVEDFGRMIVTLICGRRKVEDILEWVYKEWSEGRGQMVVDARVEAAIDLEELDRVLRIAFWCLQYDERLRPSMGEVVKVLEGTLCVDPPPPPLVFRQLEEEEGWSGSLPDTHYHLDQE